MEKRPANGVVAIAVGSALAILSIGLAGWTSFWKILGIGVDQRVAVASAVSILFVNLGFLLAVYFQQIDFKDEVVAAQRRELQDIGSLIPSVRIYAAYSGESAMSLLVEQLPSTKVALNTRILSPKMSETSHAADSPWDNAIRRSVHNGLVFREIVSVDNVDLAQERLAASAGGKGRYQAAVLKHNLPSFMNFIILERQDAYKEVWFGWIVSKTAGWEGTVIRSGEAHIVALFERWHAELLSSAHLLSVEPAQS